MSNSLIKTKTMTKTLKEEWGQFIGSQTWEIYGTSTYKFPTTPKSNRSIMEKTFNSFPSITTMYFVSEPFGSNNSVHSHFLIKCNEPIKTLGKLKKLFDRYGRNTIELIDTSSVHLNPKGQLRVGFYVTKMVSSYVVDYDVLIK